MTDMQPETPTPQFTPERIPAEHGQGQSAEHLPQPSTPETGLERGAERKEQAGEAGAVASNYAMPTPVVPDPATTPLVSAADPAASDSPLVADDADLIEKEWVDKAKSIISSTRDDPARREAQVSQLQKDYLRKRYGKELGAAG